MTSMKSAHDTGGVDATANDVRISEGLDTTKEEPNFYKLELQNLFTNPTFAILKNLLVRRFKVNPRKIKTGRNNAFLYFKSESERDQAVKSLDNQELKGRILAAKAAAIRDDPILKRRRLCDDFDVCEDGSLPSGPVMITDEDINERICPLLCKPYEEQLKIKESIVRNVLNMSKQIQKMSQSLEKDAPSLYQWTIDHKKISCEFDGIAASPILTGYRNKCEFNISKDGEIGFKIGKYRDGSDRVCRPPKDCPLLTSSMFEINSALESYMKDSSTLKPYDMVSHQGHFRQLTIRSNSSEEHMLIIDINPQDLPEEKLGVEIDRVVESLKSNQKIVSIYFNVSSKNPFSSAHQSLKLVHGSEFLLEKLSVDVDKPLSFRIGPASFFQVNTKAAELLYRSIIEVAQLGPNSMVLDVGCGTGTIGLSLAHKVNHVIGIEIVREAINDAKANAVANGIQNASFYVGRAEDLLSESITILKNKLGFQSIDGDIVAIVDPPRAGFTNSFIKTLRASEIKRIVYIACDPKANTNLLSLCRPKSKAYQGEPFVPVRAKAFDLFPHTKCCELLVVYERLSMLTGTNKSLGSE